MSHKESTSPFAIYSELKHVDFVTDVGWASVCGLSVGPRIVTAMDTSGRGFLLNPRATKLQNFFCQFCGKQMSLYTLVSQHWTGTKRSCPNLLYNNAEKEFTPTTGYLPRSPHPRDYRHYEPGTESAEVEVLSVSSDPFKGASVACHSAQFVSPSNAQLEAHSDQSVSPSPRKRRHRTPDVNTDVILAPASSP
jgi:hypothetical protein